MVSGFWDNKVSAQTTMQRLASLRYDYEKWTNIKNKCTDLNEIATVALNEKDESINDSIYSELSKLSSIFETFEFELQLNGDFDEKTAILSIKQGAGGVDAQDWSEMLLRMYTRWAEHKKFSLEILDLTPGEEAGIKSATIKIIGRYAYGYLRSEKGVHRLVRLSPFDTDHARHTSFAKVEVMPEVVSSTEIEISSDDLRVDVFRASGHGGQNVQKNSTAIRITHLPTGIVVSCQNERSQHRNRESALKVLESRLLEQEMLRQEEERKRLKGEHVDMAFGSQIRSYVLHPYKMVKDHRTDFETSDASAVLDGELDDLIAAFLRSRVGENRAEDSSQ